MDSLTEKQIDTIKRIRDLIHNMAYVQDSLYQGLLEDLKLENNEKARDFLFDYCFNENSDDRINYYIQEINKSAFPN